MKSIAESYLPIMIETRRYMHMYPEVSFVAHETQQYILKKLEQYKDLVVQAPIGDTLSIVATIGQGHPHIAFRADLMHCQFQMRRMLSIAQNARVSLTHVDMMRILLHF